MCTLVLCVCKVHVHVPDVECVQMPGAHVLSELLAAVGDCTTGAGHGLLLRRISLELVTPHDSFLVKAALWKVWSTWEKRRNGATEVGEDKVACG